MIPFADLQALSKKNRKLIFKAFRSVTAKGFFVGGSEVLDFEQEFAEYLGVRHVVSVGSGLDALRMCLEAWGIGAGDEVIVPGFTFFGTWLSVSKTDATIVAVDVNSDDATLNTQSVEAAITSKTKAIIPVHLYGNAADVLALRRLVHGTEIKILEDVAQAHGGMLEGRRLGSIGDAGAFSFYPTKNLGALGDGGAVATNCGELDEALRSMRNYGTSSNKFDFIRLGTNSRLDALQAAFLRKRLRQLDRENAQRRKDVLLHRRDLDSRIGKVVGPENVDDSVWHILAIDTANREAFVQELNGRGIGTDFHYPYSILDVAELLSKAPDSLRLEGELPASRALADNVVSLPLGPWVKQSHKRRISSALRSLANTSRIGI